MEERNQKIKIAIIDDSETSRRAIEDILVDQGYKVVGNYSNGTDALKDLQSSGANLFIIDVVMPGASGIEVAKIINEKTLNSKIIMMSSLKSENIVLEAISNGALDFINKPFQRIDLIKSVEKIESEWGRD